MRWFPKTFTIHEVGDAAMLRLYAGIVYGPQIYLTCMLVVAVRSVLSGFTVHSCYLGGRENAVPGTVS